MQIDKKKYFQCQRDKKKQGKQNFFNYHNHKNQEKMFKKRQHKDHQYVCEKIDDVLVKKNSKEERYQKLQHLEEMKKIRLEQLNCKIKGLINKIDAEDNSLEKQNDTNIKHQRVKTECLSQMKICNRKQLFLNIDSDSIEDIRSQVEPKIKTPTFTTEPLFFKTQDQNESKLWKIKLKYKKSYHPNNRLQTQYCHKRNQSNNSLASTTQSISNDDFDNYHFVFGKKRNLCQDQEKQSRKTESYQQSASKLNFRKTFEGLNNLYHNFEEKINNHIRKVSVFEDIDIREDSNRPTAMFRNCQDKNQLQFFLQNLINQIKIDSQFREAKKWFSNIFSQYKWSELSHMLQSHSFYLSFENLKQYFSLQQDQIDPFYSVRSQDYSISSIVKLFIKSEENWKQQILHKYNQDALNRNGLKEYMLDVEKKGYIAMSDLVRFINIKKDVQLRNRDISMIYRRFKNGQKLKFADIINQICNDF